MIASRSAAARQTLPRWEFLVAFCLTCLIVAFHFLRFINAGALWRDEAGGVQLATLPTIGEVIGNFEHEGSPLLFPFFIRAYTSAFGQGDVVLRLLGTVIG